MSTDICDAQSAHLDDARYQEPPYPDMIWIPGGTFRMGSDKHYPEEAPVTPRHASMGSGSTARL